MNNQFCFKSLYQSCACNLQIHLKEHLPIIDAHCHFDDFSNQYSFFESISSYNCRKIFLISNKHKFRSWRKNNHIHAANAEVFETYGMHPKFLDEHNVYRPIETLRHIIYNRHTSPSGRPIVGVGETGLDDTSSFTLQDQKIAFIEQILIARDSGLPLILHCRGYPFFRCMLDILKSFLPPTHCVQWHCVKSDSDLEVIDNFISAFRNSLVSINGAATLIYDIDRDKIFKKWIRNHNTLLDHIALETDCPWLCPSGLSKQTYNPATGIFVTSKWLENVMRQSGKNASNIIRIANSNTIKLFTLKS